MFYLILFESKDKKTLLSVVASHAIQKNHTSFYTSLHKTTSLARFFYKSSFISVHLDM